MSLAAAGDVDGDGVGDFIAGAPQRRKTVVASGYAVVISGSTRKPIHTLPDPAGVFDFGLHVAAAGDFNGDGFDDVAVSMRGNLNFPRVDLYSGRDANLLFSRTLSTSLRSIAGLGDMDGDSFGDLAIASNDDVAVISGRLRVETTRYRVPNGTQNYGARLAAGDFDGDGLRDLVIADPAFTSAVHGGMVFVYSGLSNSLLIQRAGTRIRGELGHALAVADFDGDGRDDLAIGEPHTGGVDFGAAYVLAFDGSVAGRIITSLTAPFVHEQFGADLAMGDFDGDGLPDLAVGAPRASEVAPDAGRMTAFVNNFTSDPGRKLAYGAGCGDAFGRRARMGSIGRPVLGSLFHYTLRAAPFTAPGVLALGRQRQGTPLAGIGMPGCTLLLAPTATVPGTTDGSGAGRSSFLFPSSPGLIGATWQAQWFVLDPLANLAGLVSSGALELRLGRG